MKRLGNQELELLKHVAEAGPSSVGEIFAAYGEPNGLARSTVETVLERLRGKGYVTRSKKEGAFRYRAVSQADELMGGLVEQFVENTLGGSLVPFATYFAKQNRLSHAEKSELERLLQKLEKGQEE